jgi:glucose/arabinose dehydrogenase
LAEPFANEQTRVRVPLTDVLVQPWALAFMPNGDILITERAGRLRSCTTGGWQSRHVRDLFVADAWSTAGGNGGSRSHSVQTAQSE